MNYAELAFSEQIKSIQQRMGSRTAYERFEQKSFVEGLSEIERSFIEQMDSFYIASLGENGFPYIQHRGGPKGFLKVIDAQTIGLVDFAGNRQFITVGNVGVNPKVSLILVRYPLKARLKVYAEAEIVEMNTRPDLYDFLIPSDYSFKPERILLLHIKAYDWNCPQHISPKYSLAEIEELNRPKDQYIRALEEQVERLRSQQNGMDSNWHAH